MASELIQLRAKAKKAGIPAEQFKGLGIADLKKLIAGGSKPAAATKGAATKGTATKGAATKGVVRKPAAKAPVRKPAVVKPTAKKAPAKSTPRKSTAKPVAAKGTAKRPSSAAVKPAARKATASAGGRNMIDNSQIDWTADWNGGKSGNRLTIIKALRSKKGDTAKVFALLADKAQAMYPKNEVTNVKRTKAEAQKSLRWAISRVKLDFVLATGQHESSTNRAGYGESTDEGAVERRKATAKARKGLGIKAPARGRVPNAQLPGYKAPSAGRKGTAASKPAPKRTAAQKPAQKRTAPAPRKPVARPAARK